MMPRSIASSALLPSSSASGVRPGDGRLLWALVELEALGYLVFIDDGGEWDRAAAAADDDADDNDGFDDDDDNDNDNGDDDGNDNGDDDDDDDDQDDSNDDEVVGRDDRAQIETSMLSLLA